MTKRISNEAHETAVIRKVYSDAATLDWEHITQGESTKQYDRWLDDKQVGGILDQWMSRDEMRVWLKDGPLKELARARANFGKYAKYLDEHPYSAEVILPRALGAKWVLVPDSVDEKPLQCLATNGTQTTRLFWGPEKDFKHLIWAALLAWEADEAADTRLVVFDTVAAPLVADEQKRLERIAYRAKMLLICVRV